MRIGQKNIVPDHHGRPVHKSSIKAYPECDRAQRNEDAKRGGTEMTKESRKVEPDGRRNPEISDIPG